MEGTGAAAPPTAGPPPPPPLPKNPAGGPAGAGGSPVLSPGAGRGNQEAARAQVKMMLEGMRILQMSFDVYSDEYNALAEAIRSLRSTFGKKSKEIVPAAILQMAMTKNPFAAAPPAGIQGGRPPRPAAAALTPGGL